MSYPLQFLVVLTMAFLGCTKVTLQGRASRKFFQNGADSVLFHTMLFLFVALTLVSWVILPFVSEPHQSSMRSLGLPVKSWMVPSSRTAIISSMRQPYLPSM